MDDSSYGEASDNGESNECLLSTGRGDDDDDESDLSSHDGDDCKLGDGDDAGERPGVWLPNMICLSLDEGDNGHGQGAESDAAAATSTTMMHKSFWDPNSTLYKAVQQLVAAHNAQEDQRKKCHDTGACRRTLHTPSAAEADAQSQEWTTRIDGLVEQEGTLEQEDIWKNASSSQRDAIVSVFFLPRELGGLDGGGGGGGAPV